MTRGPGTLGLNPNTCERPNVFIIADAITLYPSETYTKGMAIITASTMRNHPAALSPRLKSMNYLNNILAKIEAIDAGVPEALMLNHQGLVAECTGDNVFVVQKHNGKPFLRTPTITAGALEGVTLATVIDLAAKARLRVDRTDLSKLDLYAADEMFLTGTAAEVVPVTSIDGRTIGDGKPGRVTMKLSQAFHKLVANRAPED